MKGSFRGNKNNFLYNYFFKIKNIKHAFGFGWNRFFRRSGSGFFKSGSGSIQEQTNEIKMMFLIRCWWNLTKKVSVESTKI